MNTLLQLALAPTLVCLIYIYIRDKYEKEPIRLLFLGILYGIIISFPIIQVENLITLFAPQDGFISDAFFTSFCVAGFVEEGFKYTLLYFLVWRNKNFNERFDGIVYSVFISLGFAGFENVLYVFNPELGGLQTAMTRAIFSVPGHALFGVLMGYYFALARFQHSLKHLILAFVVPFLFHGLYDFILLSERPYLAFLFVPFVAYMWFTGFKKMKIHLSSSPFKTNL